MIRSLRYLAPLAVAMVPATAMAQAADPALQTIEGLNNGLLGIMKAGAGAGLSARARQIGPAIDRAFDIPLMTRLSVGPAWNGFSPSDQQALVSAFRAVTVAQFAKNFDGYEGERFTVVPQVETRGTDKLVRTSLGKPGGGQESLNYRLRMGNGQWKVIDVYFRNSISQLATKRSDYASVVASGGAPALIQHLNRLAANPK
jgi:phospholipid transport system substrate-binding protein